MPKNHKLALLLARFLLGGLAIILFLTLFLVSDWQHWSLALTLGLTVILFVLVNVGYIWLFWLARRQQLLHEEKDDE